MKGKILNFKEYEGELGRNPITGESTIGSVFFFLFFLSIKSRNGIIFY